MSKIYICDICGRRHMSIQLKYRIKFTQWLPGMLSPYTEMLQLCEDCWHDFLDMHSKALNRDKAKS